MRAPVAAAALLVVLSAARGRAQDLPRGPEPDGGTVAPPSEAPAPAEPTTLPAEEAVPAPLEGAASPATALPEVPPLDLSGDSLQMSAAELAALGLDAEAPELDLSLQISGFVDVGFGFQFGPKDSTHRATNSTPPHSTFYVGNFNVYLAKPLTERVRMMSEVRLSFLPNGSNAFGLQTRSNTTAYDYTDFGRPVRWGGIILQRVYIEWDLHQLLGARVGQFLTPYGVWNVDHGSPVYIPVKRPWSIGVGWIPERQTGIELYGRAALSRLHSVGYHLTVSNGTGPVSEYADLDENKAVGGRAYWEFYGLGRLRLGASGYYGRDTDASQNWIITSTGQQKSSEEIYSQFDTLTWAADLTWEWQGLHVQTEWITNQRAYTQEGRRQFETLAGTRIIPVDYFSWGGYGLIGYRLPWLGIMPYFVSERVQGDLLQLKMKLYTLQFGLNIRPTESIVVKASYERVTFHREMGADPLQAFQSQIAWAF